jgi:hypothetical protein
MSCTAFKHKKQPPVWDHKTTDDVYIKRLYLETPFSVVPQHAHKYAHTTLLTAGSVKVWVGENKDFVVYNAPAVIQIPAETKHMFVNISPDTELFCIHNVMRTGEVEIHEENDPFKDVV